MSSSSSSSSTSSSSSSSSSSEGPVMTHDLCQVLINDKHSVNHRRKRKSVVLHPSSGQQSWLLSEVKRLQKEVKKLKKENATLMHLNWKLQETFPKMIDLLSGQALLAPSVNTSSIIAVPRSGNEEPVSKNDRLSELCPPTRKSAKRTTEEHKINNTSNSSMALCQFLSEEQLNKACLHTSNYKKVIGNLMECLFTEEEMLSCSVTGINTSKQPLDACKTTALIDFITANFPHVTVPQVKQRMGNKLRDKRQLQIRTASINPAHWMLQQS